MSKANFEPIYQEKCTIEIVGYREMDFSDKEYAFSNDIELFSEDEIEKYYENFDGNMSVTVGNNELIRAIGSPESENVESSLVPIEGIWLFYILFCLVFIYVFRKKFKY